jgi:glycine/sarcosine N-methyltransferase
LPSFDSKQAARDFVDMIAWDKRLAREGPFFRELFKSHGVRSVLDLACGPGRHAALFASWKLDAWGVDGSREMIRLARSYAQEQGLKVRFVPATYGRLSKSIPRRFDAVISIGNSLVQVSNRTELETLMKEVKGLLNPGGIFLSQTKNYDGYEEGDLEVLPVTTREAGGKNAFFLRMHQREGNRIRFYSVKLIPEENTWKATPRMTWFYRVTQANLARALQKANFNRAQWYGGYDRTPFRPKTSPDLVVLARTPE